MLAAPIERDGAVVGMVQVETRPGRDDGAVVSPRSAVWWWAGAVLLFALLSNFVIREGRRWLLAAISAVLLVVAIAGYGRQALHALETHRRAIESSVAAQVDRLAHRTTALLAASSLDTTISAAAWDADSFRHPRGLIRADGTIDEAKLAGELAASASEVKKAIVAVGLLSLGILAFIGFGAASNIGLTLFRNRSSYYYILPAMIGMIVLVFFPFFYGIALSFTDANIYNTDKSIAETWSGIKNYTDILGDFNVAGRSAGGQLLFNYKNFYWTFYITIIWTISNVTIGVTVGLALALILNTKGLALRPIYRVLLILPWAMPNYITALIWKGMFHRQFGVINQVMEMLGGSAISWFDSPTTSFLTNLATNGWLSFPFMMVVSLGALQSIPAELYEAAVVDGASRWQQFKAITLPSIKPALIPAIILSVVWTFNQFNIIYLVSAGEPGSSTEILITQAYRFAFQEYRYGYAAAYSTVIFAILIVYATVQNRVTRATEAI
ncbi:MAG: ABC transporter permease subunit [Acidobacteria bacterium]|nr:ABC transporter permease subunit [Acidobacteriota bacterium]